MFIVIEDDIFENIEQIDSAFNIKLRVLDELFESMLKGKHIVYSKAPNLTKIVKTPLLGERTRQYVSWILREYSRVYSCKSIVQKYISVSGTYVKLEYDDSYYKVPLEYVLDITETKLLTEHESDAKFYQQITNYINQKGKISTFFAVCFENDSYHGGNAKSKIEQVSEGNRYVLCVVDTDKDYPEDGKKATYKCANDAIKKARKKIVIDLLELPVREKENLFPATVYNKFTDLEIVRVIAEKFSDNEVITNFFDIKGGIKYKKILNPNEKWTGYYGGLIEECKKQRICNTSLTEQESEKVYITGIGDKICDGVADALFIGSSERIRSHFTNMTKEKVEEIEQNRAQILTAIPLFVLNNWQQIASPMFTWGCCINTNRYPVQRNW